MGPPNVARPAHRGNGGEPRNDRLGKRIDFSNSKRAGGWQFAVAKSIRHENWRSAADQVIERTRFACRGWLPFLEQAGIPERMAQRYVVLAESRLESDTVTLLGGISAALRFLALRKRACAALDEAERQARAGLDGIEPIKTALDIIVNEMVPMLEPDGGTP